jgi:hypothetical protein
MFDNVAFLLLLSGTEFVRDKKASDEDSISWYLDGMLPMLLLVLR